MSAANLINAQLEEFLAAANVSPKNVFSVLKAIAFRGVGPRGAVTVAELVDALGVPERDIFRLAAAELIDVRYRNPSALDYPELKPLGGEAYVSAPNPLAKESILNIVKRLETRKSRPGDAIPSPVTTSVPAGSAVPEKKKPAPAKAGASGAKKSPEAKTGDSKAEPKGKKGPAKGGASAARKPKPAAGEL
jgi:hypothetical protein